MSAIRRNVAKLLQGDKMTRAQQAFQVLADEKDNRAFISACLTTLGGTITKILWNKHRGGVSENVTINFLDGTGIQVNRHLNANKTLGVKVTSL